MVYRVSNLVSDCSTGRGRLKISGSGKRDAYAAVWDCLCKWIKDQYQRGKVRTLPAAPRARRMNVCACGRW